MAFFRPRSYRASAFTVHNKLGRLSFKEIIGQKMLGLNPSRVRELGLHGAHELRRNNVLRTLGLKSKQSAQTNTDPEDITENEGEDGEEEQQPRGRNGQPRPRGKEAFAANIRSSVLGSTEKSVAGNEQIAKNLSVVASIIEKKGDEQADLFEKLFTLLEQVPVTQRQAQTQQDRLMHQIAKLVVAIEKEADEEKDPERQEKLDASANTLRKQGEYIGRQREIPTHWERDTPTYSKLEATEQARSRMSELMERERNDVNESRAKVGPNGPNRGLGVIDRDATDGRDKNTKSRIPHAPHNPGTMKYFLDKILQESIAQRKLLERNFAAQQGARTAPIHTPTPAQPTAKATTAPVSTGRFEKGNMNHTRQQRGVGGKFQKKDAIIAPAIGSGTQAEKIESIPSVEDQAAAKPSPTSAPSTSWLSGLLGLGKKAVGGVVGAAETTGVGALAAAAIPAALTGSIIGNSLKDVKIDNAGFKRDDETTTLNQQINLRNQLMKRGMSPDAVKNEMHRRFGKGLVTSPSAPSIPGSAFAGAATGASVGLPPSNLTARIDTPQQTPASAPQQTIINHNDNSVTHQGGGGANFPSPPVRTTDNSFIRFQDKRQVRVL